MTRNEAKIIHSEKAKGYRGIWFTLGQVFEYGDKYSGGLGTYTANHNPLAVYSAEANQTYFVYGGTPDESKRYLLCLIGCYDHTTGKVQRPTVVYDKGQDGVDDPHDNPSISIDQDGYVWVFVSGRTHVRNGIILKSTQPHSIDAFEEVHTFEGMAYPQPWPCDEGFLLMFTKYTRGRELYFSSSSNGADWGEAKKLAGFGGHYQVSAYHRAEGKIGTFFNFHPSDNPAEIASSGGDVDLRTNLYYMESKDGGETWTNLEGAELQLPLNAIQNEALVIDFEAKGLLQYACDLNWDVDGNPLLLYVTATDYKPGPLDIPRAVCITRWNGSRWITSEVTNCSQNYDMGSLYVTGSRWTVLFPSGAGPQSWGPGGEIEAWVSDDQGATWQCEKKVTQNSPRNHSFVRRPLNAAHPFMAFWADGNPEEMSISKLYFSDLEGSQVCELPYDMDHEWEKPLVKEAG